MNKLKYLSDVLFGVSISILIVYFVLYYKDICDCMYIASTGLTMLLLSIIILIVYLYIYRYQKEELSGFEAWVERIDFIVEKYLKSSFNEDEKHHISNSLAAFTILNKSDSENIIKHKLNDIQNDLLEKGINIDTDILYKIYKDANDVITDEYRDEIIDEIIDFFKYVQINEQLILMFNYMTY